VLFTRTLALPLDRFPIDSGQIYIFIEHFYFKLCGL